MKALARLTGLVRNLHSILGAAGLMIGVLSAVSLLFGVFVFVQEYDRPRQTVEQSVHRVLENWVRAPDYLGMTLADQADLWRKAPPGEKPLRLRLLREAFERLCIDLDQYAERFPLLAVLSMELITDESGELARWASPSVSVLSGPATEDSVVLTPEGETPPVTLRLSYRAARALGEGARNLETSYRRLLLALIGLSGFSLLCLCYMMLHARALSERVAREAAQEATLDLADRTCHELGNGVFVLSNERRNLDEHLDLVERFIAEGPQAQRVAARKAGLSPEEESSFRHALRREFAERGIDPDVELRGSANLARHVCHQIAVCSDYISLTVRELDGFLRQSALPVELGSVDVAECIDEALALLRPRLDAAEVEVVRGDRESPRVVVRADRRLLIHALVNLIKNAVEATRESPQVELTTRIEGRRVWLGVRDNGPGVAPTDLSQLFEPGFSTKGAGRGRGLSVVRESVQLQSGTIVVTSPPEGGTLFEIGLDCAEGVPIATPGR